MDRTQPAPSTRHTIAVGILGRRAGRTIATVRTATGTTGTVRHDDAQIRQALTSRTPDAPAPVAPSLNARLGNALGLRHLHAPRPELGETSTRICIWSVRELDAIYGHAGGTVAAQQIDRTTSGGSTYTVIEITVTVNVPAVGPVAVFTDWEPAEEVYAFALPVIRALSQQAPTAHGIATDRPRAEAEAAGAAR